MFQAASLDISVPLPPLRHVNVFEDLPLALCERPQHADPDWLLQQPFCTYHVAPATIDATALIPSSSSTKGEEEQQTDADQVNTAAIAAAADATNLDAAGDATAEVMTQSPVQGSDTVLAGSETVSGSDTLVVDPPPTQPQVTMNWGKEPIRVISEHLATKDFDEFVLRVAQVTHLFIGT